MRSLDRFVPRLRNLATTVLFVGLLALVWPSSLGGRVDYVMVSGTSMEPGLHTGDLVMLRRTGSYEVGDVVAYRVPEGQPGEGMRVIHRIVGGNGAEGYEVLGDNKTSADPWLPTDADVIGERYALLPGVAGVLRGMQHRWVFATLAAAVAFGLVLSSCPRSTSDRMARSGTPLPEPS